MPHLDHEKLDVYQAAIDLVVLKALIFYLIYPGTGTGMGTGTGTKTNSSTCLSIYKVE